MELPDPTTGDPTPGGTRTESAPADENVRRPGPSPQDISTDAPTQSTHQGGATDAQQTVSMTYQIDAEGNITPQSGSRVERGNIVRYEAETDTVLLVADPSLFGTRWIEIPGGHGVSVVVQQHTTSGQTDKSAFTKPADYSGSSREWFKETVCRVGSRGGGGGEPDVHP